MNLNCFILFLLTCWLLGLHPFTMISVSLSSSIVYLVQRGWRPTLFAPISPFSVDNQTPLRGGKFWMCSSCVVLLWMMIVFITLRLGILPSGDTISPGSLLVICRIFVWDSLQKIQQSTILMANSRWGAKACSWFVQFIFYIYSSKIDVSSLFANGLSTHAFVKEYQIEWWELVDNLF